MGCFAPVLLMQSDKVMDAVGLSSRLLPQSHFLIRSSFPLSVGSMAWSLIYERVPPARMGQTGLWGEVQFVLIWLLDGEMEDESRREKGGKEE
ncbi:uncharacterized [Tachysurus ichikawai]